MNGGESIRYVNEDHSQYVRSPLNYTGNKFRLLDQIIPLMPKEIATFYDVFGGGCNVGINSNAKHIVYNDIVEDLVEFFINIYKTSPEECARQVEETIKASEINEQGVLAFDKLKTMYNTVDRNWCTFFILSYYSYNNQCSFDTEGNYSAYYYHKGDGLTKRHLQRLEDFCKHVRSLNMDFTSKRFADFDTNCFNTQDFVYIDPPYLITSANYNDPNKGFGWDVWDEIALIDWMDALNEKGVRFMLSNVVTHGGKVNTLLQSWLNANQLNIYEIDTKLKPRGGYPTKEILVTNY